MSKVWKGISKFFIRLLNYSYNNRFFELTIFFSGILYLVLLLFFNNSIIYKAVNIVYGVCTSMYIAGWAYDSYKSTKRIEELETQINNEDNLVSKEFLREDLADVMHQIWANDILSSNKHNSSEDIQRAQAVYFSLPDDIKQVNRVKADRVIKLLESSNVI